MVKKIKSELVPLTLDLAINFSKMAPMPGERLLSKSRLKFFSGILEADGFNSPTWSKAIVGDSPIEYRADGQHTSNALANCERSKFPDGLQVTIHTYHLDSLTDRAVLFDLFDNPKSARSNVDKIGVYTADFPELAGIDRNFLAKVAHGIDYFYRDAQKTEDTQISFVISQAREQGQYYAQDNHRQLALWIHQWRNVQHSWMIGKPGIVAEMFADWSMDTKVATEFWAQVLTESNPDPEDDTRDLSRTLKDWARKTPIVKQDKFRFRAKKIWDRYRKLLSRPPEKQAA
jgi:hypothetical protein